MVKWKPLQLLTDVPPGDERVPLVLVAPQVEPQSNPTEQAWGLRVAFDLIKDKGRATEGGRSEARPSPSERGSSEVRLQDLGRPPLRLASARPDRSAATASAGSLCARPRQRLEPRLRG